MFRILLACCLALFSFNAFAVCSTTPLAQEDAFRLSVMPLNDRTVEARIEIEPCYLLYQNKLKFRMHPAKLQKYVMPVGTVSKDPFFGRVSVFRKSISVILPFNAQPPGSRVTLYVDYQGCAEAIGVCYPRATQMLTFIVPRGSAKSDAVYPEKKPLFNDYTNPVFGSGMK